LPSRAVPFAAAARDPNCCAAEDKSRPNRFDSALTKASASAVPFTDPVATLSVLVNC